MQKSLSAVFRLKAKRKKYRVFKTSEGTPTIALELSLDELKALIKSIVENEIVSVLGLKSN